MGTAFEEVSTIDARSVASVLSEIARTASETLHLQDVIGRIATSTRRVIPLDNMAVIRILDGEWAIKHAVSFHTEGSGGMPPCLPDDPACRQPMRLTSWSPRLRPHGGTILRIDDTWTELDPHFYADEQILKAGIRSMIWEPFGGEASPSGGVGLSAFRPNAFDDQHREALRPIAALLGAAVEHWRMWDEERRRRQRLDQLEALITTLAESLDVREVFTRISAAAQPLVPHDVLSLTELDVTTRRIRSIALSGEFDGPPPPEAMTLTPDETERRALDFELVRDIRAEIATTERERIMMESGMRSWLRVPVWLAGEARWSLGFFHREPARYDQGDVEIASRLADRIALMMSHQRLAEEARVAAEARERADRLEATVATLARELESRGRGRVVGVSGAWKETMIAIGRVAPSDTTVLITGESGTGKEVVSSLIHQGSPRAARPFVAINCAALPEQLLESELFGHEKGAFTGAIATQIGRIEQASGGTLFLDEIGEMSPLLQAKLLRVLEAREFQRVGGTRTLKADVRVIAATHRDLPASIERKEFREDLYYRLNVFQIHLSPLRERRDDIVPLAEAFLADLGRTMGRPAAGLSRDGREGLLAHPWPGNVRELRNAIERAILISDGGLVTRDHLPSPPAAPLVAPAAGSPAPVGAGSVAGAMNVAAAERTLVERALSEARGNKTRAARLLGITRAQLYWRIDKYGLD